MLSSTSNWNVLVKFHWLLKGGDLTQLNWHSFCLLVLGPVAVIPWFALGELRSLCALSPWLVLGSGLGSWSESLSWSLTWPYGVGVQKEDDSCGKQTVFFSSATSVGPCVALYRLLHCIALFSPSLFSYTCDVLNCWRGLIFSLWFCWHFTVLISGGIVQMCFGRLSQFVFFFQSTEAEPHKECSR